MKKSVAVIVLVAMAAASYAAAANSADFSGTWELYTALSDDPRAKLREAMEEQQGGGRRGPMRGGLRGRGALAGLGGEMPDRESMQRRLADRRPGEASEDPKDAEVAALPLVSAAAGAVEPQARTEPIGETVSSAPFENGARSLYAGHSFFVPVARAFDTIGRDLGLDDHQVRLVFAPGHRGAPGALWNDDEKRSQIEAALRGGDIDLLGFAGAGGGGGSVKVYARWIELALDYNPDTSFLIAQGWTFRGPKIPTSQYDDNIEDRGNHLFEAVQELGWMFPTTEIHFMNYGKNASVMKSRFEDGKLEDVTTMSGLTETALFRDEFVGHAGKMMLDVSALYWAHRLYGVDIDELPTLGYHDADVRSILSEVSAFNRAYPSRWSPRSRRGNLTKTSGRSSSAIAGAPSPFSSTAGVRSLSFDGGWASPPPAVAGGSDD